MEKYTRRNFLTQASCGGLSSLTLLNTLVNLKGLNSVVGTATSSDHLCDDYKALVCILLSGGNDSFNMLIPYDRESHDSYVEARSGLYSSNGGLAIPRNELQSTVLDYGDGGRQFSLHPGMGKLQGLFNDGQVSFLANIGTLTHPGTTKEDVEENVNVPISIFSHSDQLQQWQTGVPTERSSIGWAGKIGDLIRDCNNNSTISMNISLSGSNIFQTGSTTVEFALDSNKTIQGIKNYDPLSSDLERRLRSQAIDSLLESEYQDIFKNTFVNTTRNARDGYVQFLNALEGAIVFDDDVFPNTDFGTDLELIARTIDVRQTLGFKRQIFFINVGGWDHHDEVIINHGGMLRMISEGLGRFQEALGSNFQFEDSHGVARNHAGIDVGDSVLTVVMSEFGRTLSSNGNGSDHAWGGNTFVMGGQNLINGKRIFGEYPDLDSTGVLPLELGRGRYIPTLSTDQYFAEIAKWFGVSNSDLRFLYPNISEFYSVSSEEPPIGFLKI